MLLYTFELNPQYSSKQRTPGLCMTTQRLWTTLVHYFLFCHIGVNSTFAPKHWASGQPNLQQGHCVSLSRDGYWRTRECSRPINFICREGMLVLTIYSLSGAWSHKILSSELPHCNISARCRDNYYLLTRSLYHSHPEK